MQFKVKRSEWARGSPIPTNFLTGMCAMEGSRIDEDTLTGCLFYHVGVQLTAEECVKVKEECGYEVPASHDIAEYLGIRFPDQAVCVNDAPYLTDSERETQLIEMFASA